jgi:hypothetical protein
VGVSIRLFVEAAAGPLVEIRNQVEPEPMTVARFLLGIWWLRRVLPRSS